MEKILITGTGRCGTTFLIKLFSFLDFKTGYNRNNYHSDIASNCNSGMERGCDEKFYILKNPEFLVQIKDIVQNPNIKIKKVIIPLRDLTLSARSRVNHGNKNGGLWNAFNEISQIDFYKNILIHYLLISTQYDIDTIYLDFDRMVNDYCYLYNKLKTILDEKKIDLEKFRLVYNEVSTLGMELDSDDEIVGDQKLVD